MRQVHLSSIIEGVECALDVGPVTVRTIVTAALLQSQFGATSEQQSWAEAFAHNEDAITALAIERYRTTGKLLVVLNADSACSSSAHTPAVLSLTTAQ